MPTYEYVCRDCGHHLEVVQSFRDEPLAVCGQCEGRLRKVFTPAGIIFKGSGYYVTDSRPKPASAGASGDGDGKADGGDKSDGGGTPDGGKSKEAADKGSSTSTGSTGDAGKKSDKAAKSA